MTVRTMFSRVPGTRRLLCRGELDTDTVPALAELAEEARTDGTGPLVLDMREVTFADSSAVNLLVGLRRDGPVVLIGPLSPSTRRVLEITGVLHFLEVVHADRATGGRAGGR
ncbi:STAS domain-containing protein [Streptomyces sp. NPDC057242]|uniref:STAS domain-containing protein n=1 Tax=unclassified Streptomyces TaxID=2593676 RepID=UPI00363B0A3B